LKTTAPNHGTRRRARGNALLEFLLTIPIIVFVAGLTITMSVAMLAKQKALVESRHELYGKSQSGWSPMKLEGSDPGFSSPGAGGANMPRGYGEDLTRLKPEIELSTIERVSNPDVRTFWQLIWDNLPGRFTTKSTKTFKTAPMWNFIETSAQANHERDSSAWHFWHMDVWKIARAGPLQEVFQAFQQNFSMDVAPHIVPTRDDIYSRWWHAQDMLGQMGQNLQAGG
jgi:hypothetical protein